MENKKKKLVIVGGGTAGWFTAGFLSKYQKDFFDITVVESTSIPRIGVGESVTPHVQGFFDTLGIDKHHWMEETGAIYKLANKFVSWVHGQGETEYFSFDYPTDIKRLFFEPAGYYSTEHWNADNCTKTTDLLYSLYQDKKLDKFDRYFDSQYHYMEKNVSPFIDDQYFLNPIFSWSQHINAEKCADYIRDFVALPNGVKSIISTIKDVATSDSGIDRLILEDGKEIHGDVFVDASGFHRILSKKLNIKDNPFKNYAVDRTVVCQLEYDEPEKEMVNYTQSIAQPYGWMFKISLYHRLGCGYCFSSSHLSDQDALDYYQKITKNRKFEPRLIKWSPTILEKLGYKNMASIGLSAGFYEPLEANSLYMTIAGIYLLNDELDQYNRTGNLNWNQFNEKMSYTINDIADFIKVHYTLSKRSDTEFWKDMTEIGKTENHIDLVIEKYYDKRNSMSSARRSWTLFPDYMWMQLAMAWELDSCNFDMSMIEEKFKDVGLDYFVNKEIKHNKISSYSTNNFLWLKENIFKNQSPQVWANSKK